MVHLRDTPSYLGERCVDLFENPSAIAKLYPGLNSDVKRANNSVNNDEIIMAAYTRQTVTLT